MPVIETMKLNYEGNLGVQTERVFNLDAAVGHGAPNRPGDVMLVQAMFQALNLVFGAYFMNLKLSEPNGRIDGSTLRAIWAVQSISSMHLLAVDGRIDPASFKDRTLRLAARKKTMMQHLNQHLSVVAIMKLKQNDHVAALLDMYPQLRGYVRDLGRW